MQDQSNDTLSSEHQTHGPLCLGLMMTRGMSLNAWIEKGMYEREIALYHHHLNSGVLRQIYVFTWEAEIELVDKLHQENRLDHRIKVVQPCSKSQLMCGLRWPSVERDVCRELDVIKTNQIDGIWAAMLIARRCGTPLFARTGYTGSMFASRLGGRKHYLMYRMNEKFGYKHCQMASVSSYADREYVVQQYGLPESRIKVVRNYLETERFDLARHPRQYRSDRLIYVGRLTRQKNLEALIKAVKSCEIGLDIYGDGEDLEALKQLVDLLEADVVFHGRVPSEALPEIYQCYTYFILPSLFEGMPKVLLEAMGCGCVPLVTPVAGNNEVVKHGENGWVASGVDASEISALIREAIRQIESVQMLSQAARQTILNEYALDVVAKDDAQMMHDCLSAKSLR